MGRLAFISVTVAMLGLFSAPCVRAAEAVDTSRADETFHEGRALLKDKRYADACPKFEESQRQDPASGTLLALAYCQELSGLLATSWANYLAAAQLAEREGQGERQSAATTRARALAERVSKLTVVVPPELLSLPGFHLMRDGIEFERASFGVATPLDGGTHAFVATAPGRVSWSSTVTLYPERDQKTLVLPVLDLDLRASGVPGVSQASVAGPPAGTDTAARSSLAYKRASLAFAGAAVIGLGLGTGFAIHANSKNNASNADGHCDGGCDQTGIALRHDAEDAARVATWSFIASGALAACSVVLYVSAHEDSSPAAGAVKVQADASRGAPGLTVLGSF